MGECKVIYMTDDPDEITVVMAWLSCGDMPIIEEIIEEENED